MPSRLKPANAPSVGVRLIRTRGRPATALQPLAFGLIPPLVEPSPPVARRHPWGDPLRLLHQLIGQRCQVLGETAVQGPPTAAPALAPACTLVATPHSGGKTPQNMPNIPHLVVAFPEKAAQLTAVRGPSLRARASNEQTQSLYVSERRGRGFSYCDPGAFGVTPRTG